MNTKNIVITTGVIASVVGLGFLSYFLFSKKEIAMEESNEQVDPSLPISQPEKMIETVSADRQEVVVNDNKKVEIEENPERFDFVEKDTHLPDMDSEVVAYLDEADSFESPIEVVKTAIDISTTTTEKQEIIEEVINDEFPLQLGSKGKRIERLQVWLLRNYGYSGKITTAFDQKTLELVKKHLKVETIDEELYNRLEMEKRVYEQSSIR